MRPMSVAMAEVSTCRWKGSSFANGIAVIDRYKTEGNIDDNLNQQV